MAWAPGCHDGTGITTHSCCGFPRTCTDEDGHDDARRLLGDPNLATVTGTWTRIEVASAIVRAGRAGRAWVEDALALLEADLGHAVAVVRVEQDHAFATRDAEQARVAAELGFARL